MPLCSIIITKTFQLSILLEPLESVQVEESSKKCLPILHLEKPKVAKPY